MKIVSSTEQSVQLNTLTIDLVGWHKTHDKRVSFGNLKDYEHIMFSRSRWENFAGKKILERIMQPRERQGARATVCIWRKQNM